MVSSMLLRGVNESRDIQLLIVATFALLKGSIDADVGAGAATVGRVDGGAMGGAAGSDG